MPASVTEGARQVPIDQPLTVQAFGELAQFCYPRLYNYLRYRVSAVEDAQDLIGRVFEKAFANRAQFDPAKGTFSTWLFSIAHHTLVNFYRTSQRRAAWQAGADVPEDLASTESSPEGRVIQQETVTQLLNSLTRLSERDQEVISLKFAGQLSSREIGQIMDLNEKTVNVVLWRAIRRLQQHLAEDEA